MHELSLASRIFETVNREARKKKARRIISISLVLGDLTLASPQQLKFWLGQLLKKSGGGFRTKTGTKTRTKIFLKREKAKVRCRECGFLGKLEVKSAEPYHSLASAFCCPKCKSEKIEVVGGRELLIKSIKLEK